MKTSIDIPAELADFIVTTNVELEKALEDEDYKKAAQLRDKLRQRLEIEAGLIALKWPVENQRSVFETCYKHFKTNSDWVKQTIIDNKNIFK